MLGKRLNSTVAAYNEAIGSYEARVLPGARRFAEHGAVAEGREIPQLEPVTTSRAQRPRATVARRRRRSRAPTRSAARRRVRAGRGLASATRAGGWLRPAAFPPAPQVLALMGQRIGRGLAALDLIERLVDIEPSRTAITPAATAAERCQPARQWT